MENKTSKEVSDMVLSKLIDCCRARDYKNTYMTNFDKNAFQGSYLYRCNKCKNLIGLTDEFIYGCKSSEFMLTYKGVISYGKSDEI